MITPAGYLRAIRDMLGRTATTALPPEPDDPDEPNDTYDPSADAPFTIIETSGADPYPIGPPPGWLFVHHPDSGPAGPIRPHYSTGRCWCDQFHRDQPTTLPLTSPFQSLTDD